MERPQVHRTLDLDCSPADLWRLVTDDALLSTWLGRDVALDARPGGSGHLIDDDGRTWRVVVHDVVPDARLTFAWWPDDEDQAASDVVLFVEPVGEGSRLVVTETSSATSSWDARLVSLWLSVCALAKV